MPNQSGEVDSRVVDNAVILFSLLITRAVLVKTKTPILTPNIRKALLMRIAELIKQYKNPDKGITFTDDVDSV